jgi:predicted phosphodiesterase
VHANYPAVEAVLADFDRRHGDTIVCLGDLVGYGPHPRECVDQLMNCDLCLLGNWEEAVRNPESASSFDAKARSTAETTREELLAGGPSAVRKRWEFLHRLEPRATLDGRLFVHGSARDPLNEYVFPEDIYNQRKMEKIFSLIEHHCFQGHTHLPGVFTTDLNFRTPEELCYEYELGDPRACYVVVEGNQVRFRRVEFDIDRVIRDIESK